MDCVNLLTWFESEMDLLMPVNDMVSAGFQLPKEAVEVSTDSTLSDSCSWPGSPHAWHTRSLARGSDSACLVLDNKWHGIVIRIVIELLPNHLHAHIPYVTFK